MTQKSEDRLLFLLAFAFFAHIMDFIIMLPLGDELMRKLSISPSQFSFLISIYSILAGIMGFISAMFMDKYDRKHVLMVTLVGFTIGTYWCGFAQTYHTLLVARAFTGAFGGVTGGIIMSIVSDIIPFSRKGRAMGIISGAFSVASIIGVPFGLFLSTKFGDWHVPFIFFGIVSTISTIVSFYLIPNVNGHIVVGKGFKSPKTLLGNVIKDKNQSNALIWTFLLILGHFIIIPFLSPSLIRNSGFNPDRIPLIYFIGGIFTIFASYYSGKLSDRFGSKKVYLVTVLCSFVPIILLTHLGKINIIESFFVTSLFFIFASARMIPANTLVTSSVNASTMGSFMALRSCVIELGEGLAAFIGGQIIVENPNGTFSNYTYLGYISVFLSLLTLIFAYKAKVAK